MQEKNKTMLILLLLLFFVGAFLLYWFYYQGSLHALADIEQQVKQKGDSVALLTKTVNAKKEEIPTTTDLEKDLAALPIWDNTEQLVMELRGGELRSGVTLTDITFQPSDVNRLGQYGENFPTVKEVSISLHVTGTYEAIKAFLAQVEASPRRMMVDSFAYDRGENNGAEQNGTMVATITMTAYYDPANGVMVDPKWLQYPFP